MKVQKRVSKFTVIILTLTLAGVMFACTSSTNKDNSTSNEISGIPSDSTNITDTTDATSNNATTGNTPATGAVLKEGDTAPTFSFITTNDELGRLAELQGKVVFINFWASWCGPCMNEMPDINKLSQDYPNVVVIAINVADEESDAREFIDSSGYDLNWVLDDGTISALYPTEGIPYTLVIDKQGVIRTIFNGSGPNMYDYFADAVEAAGA